MSGRQFPSIPPSTLWCRLDLPTKDSLSFDLDSGLLADIEDDARRLVAAGRDAVSIDISECSVGRLAPLLDELRSSLLQGRGIALLRGFPIERLSQAEIELVFWRIGLSLGRPVSQSVMGDRLGHIIDVTDQDPNARAYRNRSELTPHTDPADLLTFLCLQPAKSGGVSRFVSSMTIHEEIRRSRPDLLERLYRGFRYHRLGEQAPGKPAVTPHRIPVFSNSSGTVSCRYVRQYIEVATDEDPEINLTDEDYEALDLFETLAADPELCIEFTLSPGEAIFANNFTVMHARTSFQDHNGPDRKRHLLRLWLAADPPRPLVPEIQHFEGEPGIPPQPGRLPSYATPVEVQ